MAKKPNISVLVVGSSSGNTVDVLGPLLDSKKIQFSIICSNLLDYELPPKIEAGATFTYRHELRGILKKLSPDNFQISESLRDLLRENDRHGFSDLDLAITNHINQIEQNCTSLEQVYDLLLKELKVPNIALHPLVTDPPPLLVFKSKKYAPLRFYYETGELLKDDPPPIIEKSKRKVDDKSLLIENFDLLKTLKLSDRGQKTMAQSDLVIIIPKDIISFLVLLKSSDLENQIKKIDSPIVLIWPFKADREPSGREQELAMYMEGGSTLGELANEISNLSDNIIIDKSDKDFVDELREAGCIVLVEDLGKELETNPQSMITSILNIASISLDAAENIEEKKVEDSKGKADEPKAEVAKEEQKAKSESARVKGKSIDQLVESPQEAGDTKIKEKIKVDEPKETTETEAKVNTKSDSKTDKKTETKSDTKTEPKVDIPKEEPESTIPGFEPMEDEEWNDTVSRAIDLLFEDSEDPAFEWLSEQSKIDNDNEVQIANEVIALWLTSRSSVDRKKGAELISKMSAIGRDTYLQVMQKEMVSAIIERQEDKRRKLVTMFNLLADEDSGLSEVLIRGLVKQLTMISDDRAFIHERNKITIIQLVIDSKKLTRVAINELLSLLDKDNAPAAQIWNILTTFDAGNVAIELVTNFSIAKADEIIRRANFLRFTGSVYKILQDVLKAWQTGDKAGISEATSEILPEETLRKFDRLELARKVQKLKMVQLTTLAESLGKDVETVERLVTELIVNDELKAEMKLIDEKMYLVAEQEVQTSN